MVENKTKATRVSVEDFIATVKSEQKRDDARTLAAMMQRISGEPPTMWGPSIIGFGTTHYVTEGGREGDICRIGFSPRSSALTFYINRSSPESVALLQRLGKHNASKGCLYIKKLADVDPTVLEQLIEIAWKNSDACEVC